MTGRLLLVPTPLDFGAARTTALDDQLPRSTIAAAAGLTHWICENAKSLRAFLGRVHAVVPLARPLQSMDIRELPRSAHKHGDHQADFDGDELLGPALGGEDVGLASEAGMPAIADPGSSVVRAAHRLSIPVVPLVGPVSLMLALAASGLNGQGFAFVGYLPTEPAARAQRIRALEALVRASGQAQLFIETPYRNAALLEALLLHLGPDIRLAVAGGLTTESSRTVSAPVSQWRSQAAWTPDRNTPAVFGIGR